MNKGKLLAMTRMGFVRRGTSDCGWGKAIPDMNGECYARQWIYWGRRSWSVVTGEGGGGYRLMWHKETSGECSHGNQVVGTINHW